ncbi:C40 family peptidase [Lapidilactobacillus wuchangensis]|uniref:C40 family peptidase n=1 Tax=Lapidilactobacillus wuchangensis TaxID=2486001 RepID=UPI000F78E934|nr:C40 family peptidase [Lapidilactobacillus wuchangensis]
MTQNKTMASLMIGMGVLATAALATQKTDETQAATRKVGYAEGATTVWTSPEAGQKVKRYLLPNQSVEFVASKKVYSQTWLQTTDGGWVPEMYLAAESTTTTNTNAATTNNAANTTATAPVATTPTTPIGTLTATYQSGATTVWQSVGFSNVKGYLATGQTAQYVATQQANGVTWYQLQNGGWVCGSFVANGDQSAQAQQPAASTETAQTTENTQDTTATAPATETPAVTTPAPAAPAESTTTEQPATDTTTNADTAATNNANSNTTVNTNNNQTTNTNQNNNTTTNNNSNQTQTVTKPVTPAPTTPSTNNNSAAKASRAEIVNYAKNFIGVPYVWGGTTPAGFDCSGLVQYVYGHFGINLPRVTYQQEYSGTVKSVASAQPGDLLFFGDRGNTYHVAISLGGGSYLHAPTPGQNVTIGSTQWFAPSFAMSVPGVY